MKKNIARLLVILMVAIACKKKADPPANTQNFAPGKPGSTWTYDTRNIVTATSGSFTLTKTSRDTVVSGRTYNVYANNNGPNAYLSLVGNEYFQYAAFAGTDQKVEILYLKNNLAVGAAWEQNVSITVAGIGTISTKLMNRVEEKGISYTVGSRTFTDVIRVKTTLGPISLPGIPLPITPTSEINNYYANSIGRIFNKTKISITIPTAPPIAVDEETSIKNYTIIP